MATQLRIRMCIGAVLVALAVSVSLADEPETYVDQKYGYKVTPPAGWKMGDLSTYTVPGKLRRAWTPDGTVSITVFVQEPKSKVSAKAIMKSNVEAFEEGGVEVREQEIVQISDADAMSLLIVGKGTGGALTPTAQRWAAIPRGKEIIVFLLTTPEKKLKAHDEDFKKMLETVRIEKDWKVVEGPTNLDFELGEGMENLPKNWGRCGQSDSPYKVSLSTKNAHDGKGCCRIQFKGKSERDPQEFAGCVQGMDAKPWLEKRVRFSGFLRTKDVKGHAGLWMRVDGPDQGEVLAFDNMNDRPVSGTTEWKQFDVVLDVPSKATDVVFGALLNGTGSMWVDDLKFEEVDKKTPVTDVVGRGGGFTPDQAARNLDFEGGEGTKGLPADWGRCGQSYAPYEVVLDTAQAHGGKNCCRVKFTGEDEPKKSGFAGCLQNFDAKPWLGKRVRYSGFLQTKDVVGNAGLWMRVDGADQREMLAFDNMSQRPVTGTTKWKKFEIVLDVSPKAHAVFFGALLSGAGTMWVDDLKFEEVDKKTPVTDISGADEEATSSESPVNLDFELGEGQKGLPKDWGTCSGPNVPYKVVLNTKEAHAGKGCCEIKFVGNEEADDEEFDGCLQSVNAKPWLGKRIRYSGFLRTKDVDGFAGLWMRVDGPKQGKYLAFDNMYKRPVKGTTEWKRYEVVLDVPPEATKVFFGALLQGTGTLWVDDLKFEEVGSDTPTTELKGASSK